MMPMMIDPWNGLIGTSSRTNEAKTGGVDPGMSLDARKLADAWGVDRETAKRALLAATQRGARKIVNPDVSRRFRINERRLSRKTLNTDLLTDTTRSSVKSQRANKRAQIFQPLLDSAELAL